jgi:hypothetical protein
VKCLNAIMNLIRPAMRELSIHRTRDLSPPTKEALEKLLGHSLGDDEEISIWTSRPHAAPVGEARKEAWQRLNQHLDRMATKADGTAEELEELVDEISDEVRHRRR